MHHEAKARRDVIRPIKRDAPDRTAAGQSAHDARRTEQTTMIGDVKR